MWPQTALLIVTGFVVVAAIAVVRGNARWRSETQQIHAQLESSREPVAQTRFDTADLVGLPDPVQRYFRTVLTEGQPVITGVRVEHTGAFNMRETGENWRPFSSTQRVITNRPGFDWEARIAMMPGIKVRVHDAYAAGMGILHASVLGLFSVVEMRGTGPIAEGELLRFLAECAWYPTALLPSQGVQWEAVDAASATATLRDGDITLTMRFTFGTNGLIESVRAEARGRAVGDRMIPTPWEGRWRNYQQREGMLIPIDGEVAWLLPEGVRPYWRGRIESISYEFAQ